MAVRENGDYLSSSSLALNAAGTAVAADQRYYAWGSARYESGVLHTSRYFTGQIKDATGLYYYNARYYDPALGRFIQPDTIVPDPANPQLFNRYTYAGNNPLRYNDPDGHCGPLCVTIAIGLVAVLAVIPGDTPHFERGMCPNHQCSTSARYETTISYMRSEMVNNAQSVVVSNIQQWHGQWAQLPWDRAELQWGWMVAPSQPWDHKPKLEKMLGLKQEQGDYYFPIPGDLDHEYFYDIWSNIHYGYVGTAAGFDAETLQSGAAVAGLAGRNDAYDELSIQIGIDLWNQHGLKLIGDQLWAAILAHRDNYYAIWRDVYNYDKNHRPPVIELTNGR